MIRFKEEKQGEEKINERNVDTSGWGQRRPDTMMVGVKSCDRTWSGSELTAAHLLKWGRKMTRDEAAPPYTFEIYINRQKIYK